MTLAISGTTGITLAGQFDSASTFGWRNRIINGGMVIDQRNAGASVATTTTGSLVYTLDRWAYYADQASKFTVQQTPSATETGYATRVAAGFTNYLACTVGASAYTVGASEGFSISQYPEGLNISDLAWGTANAKTITLSFLVYSSLTGTFGGSLRNSAGTRSYPFSYSIPTANTWTQISITIAGDTSGTWLTTNGIGIRMAFSLGSGATVSGTAGAWAAANYYSATSAVSVVGTANATWYITGVQLEKGSTATSFDFRDYGTELAMCQRYYYNIAKGINLSINGYCFSTVQYNAPISFPVQMRSGPSLVAATGSGYYVLDSSGINALTSPNIFRATQYGALLYFVVASGVAGSAGGLSMENAASSISFYAEL
jgi:hypothetical protein